ncbi:MAG: DNA repair protein RecO, partial [Actinomyces sp.]|nr:DNA repair protein RecO [Actinomyces sp.]
MRSYRDQAIVLRTHKLGEADRIVCLLTKENGQVRTVAKGVRRTTSKFGARLEPFSLIDVQLHRGRTFDIVTQVEMLRPYGTQLASDFDLFAAGTVMVETAERLTADSADGAHAQYSLLLGALHALANLRHDPVLVVDSYLLRALSVAGWAPSCFACASCGKP